MAGMERGEPLSGSTSSLSNGELENGDVVDGGKRELEGKPLYLSLCNCMHYGVCVCVCSHP